MGRSPVTDPGHDTFGGRRRGGHDDAVVHLAEGVIRFPDRPVVEQDGVSSARSVLRSLLRDMEARTGSIVEETLEEAAELDGYRALSLAQLQRVHQMMAASIAIFLRCIDPEAEQDGERQHRLQGERDGEQLPGPDGEFYLKLGASRAWSGVPLDSLREAFDICYGRANAHLTELAQQYGEVGADVAGVLARRLAKLYTVVWVTIEQGYEEALAGDRKPDDDERRALVSSVLDGTVRPDALAVAAAGSWVTAGSTRLIVAVARTPRGGLAEAVAALLAAFPGSLEGVERQEPAVHVPMLVPGAEDGDAMEWRRRLRALARQHDVTLVDTEPADLDGLGAIYRPLRGHLDLAALAVGQPGVVTVDRLMRYGAVRSACPELARWTTDRFTGPLVAARSSRWDPLATAYAVHDAEGDVEAAAQELDLAPRTVRDHLTKIGALLDAGNGRTARTVDIDLALRLLRIHANTIDPDGAAAPPAQG